jgi:hypothetical protein
MTLLSAVSVHSYVSGPNEHPVVVNAMLPRLEQVTSVGTTLLMTRVQTTVADVVTVIWYSNTHSGSPPAVSVAERVQDPTGDDPSTAQNAPCGMNVPETGVPESSDECVFEFECVSV